MQKTKNYDQFKRSELNRCRIYECRISDLEEAIKKRNLLHIRPILVTKDFEILDGNHRLQAAKNLGLDIYYEIFEELTEDDIVPLNTSRPWGNQDYFNFYLKKNNAEYLKLDKFMKDTGLTLGNALAVASTSKHVDTRGFRNGDYVFATQSSKQDLEICKQTIDKILFALGDKAKSWLNSARFFKTLALFVRDPDFDEAKWFSNLSRMSNRFGPKVSSAEYWELLRQVFNWKNSNKITSDLYDN